MIWWYSSISLETRDNEGASPETGQSAWISKDGRRSISKISGSWSSPSTPAHPRYRNLWFVCPKGIAWSTQWLRCCSDPCSLRRWSLKAAAYWWASRNRCSHCRHKSAVPSVLSRCTCRSTRTCHLHPARVTGWVSSAGWTSHGSSSNGTLWAGHCPRWFLPYLYRWIYRWFRRIKPPGRAP